MPSPFLFCTHTYLGENGPTLHPHEIMQGIRLDCALSRAQTMTSLVRRDHPTLPEKNRSESLGQNGTSEPPRPSEKRSQKNKKKTRSNAPSALKVAIFTVFLSVWAWPKNLACFCRVREVPRNLLCGVSRSLGFAQRNAPKIGFSHGLGLRVAPRMPKNSDGIAFSLQE